MDNSNENICRICLQRQDTLFSLYRKIKGSSPYEKLVKKTKLKIQLDDPGPSSICSQCLIELDTTVSFLDKCEKSNDILASWSQVFNDSSVGESGTCVDSEQCEEKLRERVDEVVGSEVLAPAEPATARCPECGSLRRCNHWAPPNAHTCQFCQKVFNRKFNYKLHLKRHLGQRDWPCPACGVHLLTQCQARRHCVPRPRRCCPLPGCGKSFTTTTNLNTHIRTHNGERPYVCVECGKSFTSKNTLTDHIRIHTGVKPYMCPVCGRRFTTNKLAAHLRTHGAARSGSGSGAGAGAGAHRCGTAGCGRAFNEARGLRLHARTHAPAGPRPHACPRCPAGYNHTQSLRKHMRRVHPDFENTSS